MEWEKIDANQIPDERLISRIYNFLIKKINNGKEVRTLLYQPFFNTSLMHIHLFSRVKSYLSVDSNF